MLRSVILLAAVLLSAAPAAAQVDNSAQDGPYRRVPATAVHVEVHWDSSWGRTDVLLFDASGSMTYGHRDMPREKTSEWQVEPALAGFFLSRLVRMGFFELPESYVSGGELLKFFPDGQVGIVRFGVVDAGQSTVRLVFGERDHSVRMPYPANTAPDQLKQWCEEVRAFASDKERLER